MTFDEFLSQRGGSYLAFLEEHQRHPLWPASSDSLDDFECFLRAHAEQPTEAIEALRGVWRAYSLHPANHSARLRFDLALAAWRDFAAHHRRCTRDSELCCVGDELFDAAIEESDFADLTEADEPPTAYGEEDDCSRASGHCAAPT